LAANYLVAIAVEGARINRRQAGGQLSTGGAELVGGEWDLVVGNQHDGAAGMLPVEPANQQHELAGELIGNGRHRPVLSLDTSQDLGSKPIAQGQTIWGVAQRAREPRDNCRLRTLGGLVPRW